ncbi:MAG: glycosyltransferase family 2 protein [Candidatus Omnitrophota bacterium]
MILSIVIPVHNEEENILSVIAQIEETIGFDHELVVVNDHSTDKSAELLKDACAQYKNIKVVSNSQEQGFANALKTGFNNISTDIVVPVMGDLCDDLSTIKEMAAKIALGFDVVCGCRYIKGGARIGGSPLKGLLSRWGGRSLSRLLGVPTQDIANAFKMYRKQVLEAIKIESKGFEVSMELPLKAYFLGFKITEVPTVWRERVRGKSSFNIFKLLPSYIKLYIWAIFKRLT